MARRTRHRSRRRRKGGKLLSKAEMQSIGNMASKTQKDALEVQNKASKAMQDIQSLKAKSLGSGVPSLCNNPFMKNSKKCQKALGAAKSPFSQTLQTQTWRKKISQIQTPFSQTLQTQTWRKKISQIQTPFSQTQQTWRQKKISQISQISQTPQTQKTLILYKFLKIKIVFS